MRSLFKPMLRVFRCRVVFVLCLGIGVTQVFGQVPGTGDDESMPGIPPGIDVGNRAGVGMPPAGQGKLQSIDNSLQSLTTGGKFHLVEASISDIHSALQNHEITCEGLVRSYLARIKTYSGQCVSYDKNADGRQDYDLFMPSGKGVVLGIVSPLPNAKKVNAISTLNLRPANYSALGFRAPDDPGPRSETDLVDNNPAMPDALEVAAQLDREFKFTNRLRPLQCIPIVIKDQMETFDMRTTDGSLTQFLNDRPPNDGTLVAKLRAAGAIIIGKANMDEYAAGSHRSSYGGQICNPYATDRDGGSSSTGSAAAPSANLAVCGIAEESGGSIQEPGSKQGLVAMTATRGLVSRFGSWPAELIRERYGPQCRTVADTAKVLDVIRGYDPKDAITATQIGYMPEVSLDNFADATSLKGKRLGIVREFMPKITVNDADSIRVFNEEVIPTLKAAGADLVESINPRDIANGWAVDDPAIPNMSIQDIVAEMVPTLEPSFANPSNLPTPSTTTGLLPNALRTVFGGDVPALFPAGTDVIAKSVEMFYDPLKFPDTINLRKLSANGAGTLNQGRYGLDKMLQRRSDPRVKSVLDLSIDFDDLNHNGDRTEHISYFMIDGNGATAQRSRPGVTPNVGVPATASGLTLDTQGEANHLFRMQSIREIVARILADNNLDALVYPYTTIPPKILTGTSQSIAWAVYDGRANRGYNAFTDNSGLPSVAVPAGLTKVVYDRTTRGSTEADALNPPAVKRDVFLPFSIVFLSRPWSEPTLLEIASGYERARGPRIPPPDFSVELSDVTGLSATSATTAPAADAMADAPPQSAGHPGLATFDVRQSDVLVSEAAVQPAEPIRSGRIYAETTGGVHTRIAIANPNDSAAAIRFSMTNAAGDVGSGSVTIPAKAEITRFLDQPPYNVPTDFQGTFSFTSDIPVGVTAIRGLMNERGEFLVTTLPVIDMADKAPVETAFVPYFADGAGWTTQIVLVNPTDNDASGTVQFLDSAGSPADMLIAGRTGSTFEYSIPKRGSQKLLAAGNGETMLAGSVRVLSHSGEAPVPLALLSYKPDGVTVSEAAIPAATGTAFRMYAESSGIAGRSGNIQSGLAITNTSPAPVTVTLDLTRLDGSPIGTAGSLTLPASGQAVQFLGELFPDLPNPFQGLLRIASLSSSAISVMALRTRYNERAEFLFTSTTPESETSSSAGRIVVMPSTISLQ
jgi:amidase